MLKLFFGSKADKDRKAIEPYVNQILAVEPEIEKLTHDELRARVDKLRERIQEAIREDETEIARLKEEMEKDEVDVDQKEEMADEIDKLKKNVNETIEKVLDEILPEAFAIVKDTARRFTQNETIEVTATDADRDLAAAKDFVTIEGDKAVYRNSWQAGGTEIKWEMIHYDVQLFGGVALHKGNVAEMATGEGKTLVATLPVFLNALSGKGVHVVTVNDYLAKRDSEWMGPIYQFHGLTVDCIDKHQPNSEARRKAYESDITFGTNNEFGFDYLRDNMSIEPGDLVQRPHHYAIVDEVDSVLIDDARTPLIISGPVPRGEDQMFEEYKPQVENLYNLQRNLGTSLLAEAKKMIAEGDEANGGLLLLRVHKGLPKYKPLIKFLSEPGMKALMQKTENLYMQNNSKEMYKVTDALYFIIDEKNHQVELTDKGHDELSKTVNDKRFFILPDIGSEVARLEQDADVTVEERLEAKDRLLNEYAMKAERVHTVNQLLKAYALFEKDTEYVLMDNQVKIVDEQTGRIMEGRRYSDGLHQAIEAKERVKVEAATQTFATITLQNYFRMYHKLSGMTGTAETEASELWNIYKLDVIVIPTNRPIIRKDFQDLIYKTKREKYSAVIEEIVKLTEAGRPVLVGTTSVEISELLSKMLKLRGIKHNVLNAKQHQQEAQVVAEAGRPGQVTIATNMAGRGTDIKLTQEVKDAGGLAIIGTERHESRRVDRQLRGRAGRQGDPGTSQFFVSLEDDLMRLFGSERIARLMDTMGLKEGEVIQAGMMTKAIERAQKKVEENNFGIRKRLLEYDDVMNSQREVIYKRRHNAVFGERIEVDLNNMMGDFAEAFVEQQRGIPYEEFKVELIRQVSIEPSISEAEYDDLKDSELAEIIIRDMRGTLKRRASQIAQQAYPVLENVWKEQGDKFENVSIPLTDGKRGLNVPVNFKRVIDSKGLEIHKAFSRVMMLITIDEDWKQHLRDMDDLKQSVQNASYEQKDPLLIYKFESFELFKKMVEKINRDVLAMVMKAYLPMGDGQPATTQEQDALRRQRERANMNRLQTSRAGGGIPAPGASSGQQMNQNPMAGGMQDTRAQAKTEPVRVEKQAGRNDPCPCGSGKKYKNCHGRA